MTRSACLIALICIGFVAMVPFTWARDSAKPAKPYDFYLTDGRVCRKCLSQVDSDGRVRLTNLKGLSGMYEQSEIIGVDTHPIARKLFLKSIHGVGLPGRVIAPSAFDDEPPPGLSL